MGQSSFFQPLSPPKIALYSVTQFLSAQAGGQTDEGNALCGQLVGPNTTIALFADDN